MNDREHIVEAKHRLPLPDLLKKLGLGDRAKKSAPCPMHDDGKASFSAWQDEAGAWAWKCHAGCGEGDEITFLEIHLKQSPGVAIRSYLKMAGVTAKREKLPVERKSANRSILNWDEASRDTFNEQFAPGIAKERGYSVQFVIWLHDQKLIGIHDGNVAFPNHDENGRVVSCHFKGPSGWRFHPPGQKTHPLVIGDAVTPKAYVVFESQWDAFAVLNILGTEVVTDGDLVFIVTRGAGNGNLVKGRIPEGKTVYAWKQNDPEKNGKRAGDEWLKDIVATVGPNVPCHEVVTPSPHKDVNDWTRAGATMQEVFDAMVKAKVVPPPVQPQNFDNSPESCVTASPTDDPVPADSQDVFYDIARKEYLVPDARGRWIANNEGQFKRRCKIRGISTRAGDNVAYSHFDSYVTELQHDQGVDFVGPLAGYPAGLHPFEDRRLLVTSGPKLPQPVPGAWLTLEAVFHNILGDEEHDQLTYWHGWVKTTFAALRAQHHKPGQAMVFVGPAECGKSLMQDLVTAMLGGREAKPYRYMTGQANFNGEMVGSEHLRIGDENPHTAMAARRNFGAQIKNIVVEATQRIEAKYYEAMTLKPFWRLTISLNDEPENMLVLPPLDEHTLDKLILFKAQKHPMPMPTATPEQKKAFWACLVSELPHYLDWLLNTWTIPENLISQRYGITHFHHPDIILEVEGFEPHRELRGMIDTVLFPDPTTEPWQGTAEALEQMLTADGSTVTRAARRLLDWRGACGRYLAKLAKEKDAGVAEHRTKSAREWIIQPPRRVTR